MGLCRYSKEDLPFLKGIMEVAKHRTADHLHYLRMVDYNLEAVLINCYMQGVLDVAEALEREKAIIQNDKESNVS